MQLRFKTNLFNLFTIRLSQKIIIQQKQYFEWFGTATLERERVGKRENTEREERQWDKNERDNKKRERQRGEGKRIREEREGGEREEREWERRERDRDREK